MKKNLFRILACVMALAMVLSLAACSDSGKKDDASSKAPVSSAAESKPASSAADEPSSTPASSSEVSKAVSIGKYASISEFLADPDVSSQLESMMSAMGDDMQIDITGEGEKLVYTFTFTEELGDDLDSISAAMKEEMADESFTATFEGIAASLSDAIEVTNPSVVVTYKAADGTEIYSQEYFPAE